MDKYRKIATETYGPIPEGSEVHHIDGNRENNDPGNLRIMTKKDHRHYHSRCAGHRRNWADKSVARNLDDWEEQYGTKMPDDLDFSDIDYRNIGAING